MTEACGGSFREAGHSPCAIGGIPASAGMTGVWAGNEARERLGVYPRPQSAPVQTGSASPRPCRGGSRTAQIRIALRTGTAKNLEETLTDIHIRRIDLEDVVEAHGLTHGLVQVHLRGRCAGQLHDALPDGAYLQLRAVEQVGYVVVEVLI